MIRRTMIIVMITLLLVLTIAVPQIAPAQAHHSPTTELTRQQAAGTVSGYVYLDGVPLADVEVWVGEFGPGGGALASHYDCTDASGYFEITGIALDTDLVSATGIEVYLAQPCANPLFLDLSAGGRGIPLLVQYWDHHNGLWPGDIFQLTAAAPTATQTFDVVRWPIERHKVLINTLLISLQKFHDGNTAQAIRMAERFIAHVERLERRGALTTAEAAQLIAYADHLINVVYPVRP